MSPAENYASTNADGIAVLGAGAWGTALACVLARNGHKISLWGRDPIICNSIRNHQSNPKYLPGIELADDIDASTDMASVAGGKKTILIVTPAQKTREICQQLASHISKGTMLVLCSKGIDRENLELPSQAAKKILPECDVAALSGPSFASDVAKQLPTAVTLAHDDIEVALGLAEHLSGPNFRIYGSDDRLGVELGGALKNVIAIAVGITRGLGLGASAEASLIARGYAEMTRLTTILGAKPETLLGLSGLGDLVLSCSNEESRNFRYGMAIGKGESTDGLPLAEGAKTVFMADALAKKKNVDCPIFAMTKLLVEGNISSIDASDALLSRSLKKEIRSQDSD